MKKEEKRYSIGTVAKMLGVHPQMIRVYEREGLIKIPRTPKNTRYFTEKEIEKLQIIIRLNRDLGVNLAGIQVILNMRERIEKLQEEVRFLMAKIQELVESNEKNVTAIVKVEKEIARLSEIIEEEVD